MMIRAGSRTCLALAMLLSLTIITFFTGGDACTNIPLMRWTDACFKACRPPLYSLCQEMLQHDAADEAELTSYVILAARLAKRSYDDTVGSAERLIATGSIPGEQRRPYQECIEWYATARNQMVSLITQLVSCDFDHAGQEYAAAVAAMVSCGRGLAPGTPLVAMNEADRDRTMVAYQLALLILGK